MIWIVNNYNFKQDCVSYHIWYTVSRKCYGIFIPNSERRYLGFLGKEEVECVETGNVSQDSVSNSSVCSTELPALDLQDYSAYKLNSSDSELFPGLGKLQHVSKHINLDPCQ